MWQRINSYTIKLVGNKCNLNCNYCYYPEHNTSFMKLHDLEKMLDNIARYAVTSKDKTIAITWHGGEPMLFGLENYVKIMNIQKQHNNIKFINKIQTNATLVNQEWCEFFKKYEFKVGISFDIDKEVHDMNRDGSYDLVVKAIKLLNQNEISIGTLTVCNENIFRKNPKDLIDKLLELGITNFDFKPYYHKKINIDDFNTGYAKFFIGLIDYFLEINNPNLNFRLLYSIIDKVLGAKEAGLCVFNPKCGNFPSIDNKGQIHICDNYDPKNFDSRLGNILETDLKELMNSKLYYEIRNKFDGFKSRESCENCEVRYICNGGCPNSSDSSLTELLYCSAYKDIFKYVEGHVLNFTNYGK